MNGRERFLTALRNGKPDRLPCQVHSWMRYYLDTYLHGMDQFEAYEYFGMDPVIYDFRDLFLRRKRRKIGFTRVSGMHRIPTGYASTKTNGKRQKAC